MRNKISSKLKKKKFFQVVIALFRVGYFIPYLYFSKKLDFEILNSEDSLELIKKNNLSVARFGDGEFNLMYNNRSIGFQPFSTDLKSKLTNSLNVKKIGIALPHGLKSTKDDKFIVKTFWWAYVVKNFSNLSKIHADSSSENVPVFLDASFGRIVTENKNKEKIFRIVNKVRHLWEDKDIYIVEGNQTFFGVDNDLLSNARSVSRIETKNVDAFSEYESLKSYILFIKESLIKQKSLEDSIFLTSLGPTATVLSAELGHEIRIIDLGHFDFQYELMQKNHFSLKPLKNRFSNELESNFDNYLSYNQDYKNQIITKIGIE